MKSLRNVITGSKLINKLTLIVKKTHFMIFHRSRMKPVSAQISLRNENTKQTILLIF